MAEPGGGLWAVLGAAGASVLWAVVARIRKHLKSGKRVFPRMRTKVYFSMSTPSDPPTELEPTDVELIDTSAQRPPIPTAGEVLEDFDTRRTTRPQRGLRERRDEDSEASGAGPERDRDGGRGSRRR